MGTSHGVSAGYLSNRCLVRPCCVVFRSFCRVSGCAPRPPSWSLPGMPLFTSVSVQGHRPVLGILPFAQRAQRQPPWAIRASGKQNQTTVPVSNRQTDGPGIGRRRGWRGVGKGSGAAETRAPPVTITLGPSREEVPRLPGLEAKGVLPLPERLDTAPPPDSWTPSPCFLGVSTGSRPGGVADLAQEASFVLHKQVHISLCDCPGAPGSSRVSRSGDACPECRQSLAPGQMCTGPSALFC